MRVLEPGRDFSRGRWVLLGQPSWGAALLGLEIQGVGLCQETEKTELWAVWCFCK